jgi:dihydroorotate dehydrogenase
MMEYFISPPFGNYLNFPITNSIKGSFTLYPRSGLIRQIILTLRYDFNNNGWVNKIGLRNKGIDYAIEKYKNTNHIVSIAILNEDEVEILNNKIPKNMNLELNVSCPNVEKNLINDKLNCFLNIERKWCIIKVSPLVDIKLIDKYYQQGFRQFHCSNTIPVKGGGLSGQSLIKYNQALIPKIKDKYKDTIIIAGGGIKNIKDIYLYQKLGINHFSFSTVFFNPFEAYKLISNLPSSKFSSSFPE